VDTEKKQVITKLVNISQNEIAVNITLDTDMQEDAEILTLTADSYYAKNTFEDKTAVVPHTDRIKASNDYTVVLKPHSINVICHNMN